MTSELTSNQAPIATYPIPDPPEPPTDLVFDDGVPLESNRHRIGMNVLINSTLQAFRDRDDFFTGGNMFVYYSEDQAMNRDYRGPDFFVTLGVDGKKERKAWVVWQENGRYPTVIVELLSPSTAKIDKGVKKELYSQVFGTKDYFVFDPFDPSSLEGWSLASDNSYEPLQPNDRGWLWCNSLQLWVGTWEGVVQRETCTWLRFYTPEGELVPLSEEAAQQQAEAAQQQAEAAQQQAEAAQQRAERLAERLRELGIDPDEV